jgi:hypothetical protein
VEDYSVAYGMEQGMFGKQGAGFQVKHENGKVSITQNDEHVEPKAQSPQ